MGKAALKKLKLSKKRQLEKDKFSDYKKKKKKIESKKSLNNAKRKQKQVKVK